jgi:DNA polymerase-3 subunit delta'
LAIHPYFKLIAPQGGKALSIDSVRAVIHFLSLKPAGSNAISRVVVIEQAQTLTNQAQNALLKTIEEPPEGTILILTAPSELGLLPTIRSRVQCLSITLPSSTELAHFFGKTYDTTAVQRALVVSDGLPGLTHALLSSSTDHPLVAATTIARNILQNTTFERLTMVDDLAKDRQLWLDTLFILARMADLSLRKGGASDPATRRWHRVLAACHNAERQTLVSAQLKLVLLNFMVTI